MTWIQILWTCIFILRTFIFFGNPPPFFGKQIWNLNVGLMVILNISSFGAFFQIFIIIPQWIVITVYFVGKKSAKRLSFCISKMLSIIFHVLYFLFWWSYNQLKSYHWSRESKNADFWALVSWEFGIFLFIWLLTTMFDVTVKLELPYFTYKGR